MRRVQGNDKISGFGFYFPRKKQQKRQKQIRGLKEDHGGGNGQVVWCSSKSIDLGMGVPSSVLPIL